MAEKYPKSNACRSYLRRIEKKGWFEIDRGLYSVVYAHKDFPYMIRKISKTDKDPWQKYIKWVFNENNKHLPRVFNISVKKDYLVVDMERLSPFEIDLENHPELFRYVDNSLSYKAKTKKPEFVPNTLPSVLNKMKRRFGIGSVDMHEGNLMVRSDNTTVITDPYG